MYKSIFDDSIRIAEGKESLIYMNSTAATYEHEMAGNIIDLEEFNRDWRTIGVPDYRINDETLAYSINAILHDFDPNNWGIISQTKFYKLLYLLSDNLKKDGIDIGLPHYWYRYGPIVPYFILPEDVLIRDQKNWGTAVIMGHRRRFELSQSLKEVIDNEVKALWDQYHELKTKKIVLDVYKKAPYEFQRKFKDFIIHIDIKIRLRQSVPSYPLKEREDIRRLEDAIDSFEELEFPQIYDDLLQWRLITKYSIEQLSYIDLTFLNRVTNIYWDMLFCKYLRVKTTENLPQNLSRKWERDLPESAEIFRKEFKDLECYFYSNIYRPTCRISKNMRTAYCDCIRSLLK